MILYIVRHAWAEDRDSEKYPDDGLRPLTSEGKTRFRSTMKRLLTAGFAAEIVATSPLVRCRETAEIIVEAMQSEMPPVPLAALEPGSDLRELIRWSRKQEVSTMAWVGHAPDVEFLASGLLCSQPVGIRFAKGATAAIDFDGEIAGGKGELRWLATAKLLGV